MAWLTKEQQALMLLMSDISEEAWCAGWMEDLEYVLWYAVLHGPIKYGFEVIDIQIIEQLKDLASKTGCWIIYDDNTRETAIPLVEWQKMFEQANPADYMRGTRKIIT
jgi:hypothetical protein